MGRLFPLFVPSVALVLLMGCGASFTTREAQTGTTSGSATASDHQTNGHEADDVSQATIPRGPIDVPVAFAAGDEAFRLGDYTRAQREFGLAYLGDPSYRQGQARAALLETCRLLGNDCFLVMGRLDLLRLEYTSQVGPRAEWVPQQEADYSAILTCYDEALSANYDTAYYSGYGALAAPLPAFAVLARQCVDRVDALRGEAVAARQRDEAFATWQAAYPEYDEAFQVFQLAVAAEDWDALVDAYPRYKLAEEPIADIVNGGALAGDPDHSAALAEVSARLAEVADWESEQSAEYERMRDAIRDLDEDPAYNQSLIEYEQAQLRLRPLEDEIATLELARNATSGDERTSVERRIDAKEAEVREVRRELRRIMGEINNIRADAGLPSREAPYGLE